MDPTAKTNSFKPHSPCSMPKLDVHSSRAVFAVARYGLPLQMRYTMHCVRYCSICGTEHRAGIMMNLIGGSRNCSTSRSGNLCCFARVMRSNQQQNNQHFHCSHPGRRSQSSRCHFIKALHCWPFLSANADSTLWAQVSIKPADHCVNVPVPPWALSNRVCSNDQT